MKKRLPLGFLPTPLQRLERLSARYPYEVWIKRDDQTGLALGGNKCRKLEYLLADALQQGADTILTAGAQQSNHCRQTAAACAQLGLECHLLLGGDSPAEETGNLKLMRLFGAQLYFCGASRKGEQLEALAHSLQQKGKHCYLVPYGGSNPIGAIGFVEAMGELRAQMQEKNIVFDYIFFASSSGGTQAGLAVGQQYYGVPGRLMPVRIDKDPLGEYTLEQWVMYLSQALAAVYGVATPGCSALLTGNDTGEYAVLTDEERRLIRWLAATEGILLDPVYTVRAFALLYDMMEKKALPPGSRLLFWHTGGLPALWAYQI